MEKVIGKKNLFRPAPHGGIILKEVGKPNRISAAAIDAGDGKLSAGMRENGAQKSAPDSPKAVNGNHALPVRVQVGL